MRQKTELPSTQQANGHDATLPLSPPCRATLERSPLPMAVCEGWTHTSVVTIQVTAAAETTLIRQRYEKALEEIRAINQQLVLTALRAQELAAAAAVAEQDRAADQLRIAEQEQQAAVTEERSSLAREIHDTLAQAFTGILLHVRIAQRIAATRPEEAWPLIEHVCELAQQGLAEARRSVWALQPEAHEYSDLAGTLSTAVALLASSTPVQMQLTIYGEPQAVPPEMGMNLLRIAQEALTNALRHAQAQRIRIELTLDAERALLRIHDDGRGSDPGHQTEGSGFGLIGMKQRADRLGGQMTIVSQPGRGTEVVVSAPIPTARHGKENR